MPHVFIIAVIVASCHGPCHGASLSDDVCAVSNSSGQNATQWKEKAETYLAWTFQQLPNNTYHFFLGKVVCPEWLVKEPEALREGLDEDSGYWYWVQWVASKIRLILSPLQYPINVLCFILVWLFTIGFLLFAAVVVISLVVVSVASVINVLRPLIGIIGSIMTLGVMVCTEREKLLQGICAIRLIPATASIEASLQSTSYNLVQVEEKEHALLDRVKKYTSAIQAEAILVVFGPIVGYLIGVLSRLVSCLGNWKLGKVPGWALFLLLPIVLRGKFVEVRLIQAVGLRPGDASLGISGLVKQDGFPMFLGALEQLDAPSDGLAIAVAATERPEVHHRFVKSWCQSQFSFLVPVLDTFGLAGMMTANQVLASYFQLAASSRSPQQAADIGGLSALARRLSQNRRLQELFGRFAVLEAVFTRVILQSSPQLMWQTSLLMARGQGVLEQPVVLFSTVISLFSMLIKLRALGREMGADLGSYSNLSGDEKAEAIGRFWTSFAVAVPLTLYLVYMIIRLVAMETCPSHSWGMTSGCVDHSV